jgi:ubiquinone/menaquinone biosynthesis C-methylase UbiE
VQLLERWLLRTRFERLYFVLGGHIFFQTLSAAIELDLFSLLAQHGKLTRPQIAQQLGTAEQPTRILLLGCVTLGLLRKRGVFYSNTFLANRLFVRSSRTNIVDVVRWQHYINYKGMHHFGEAIRQNSNVGLIEFRGTERTLYERLTHHPELEAIFQSAMQNISSQANVMLARHLDLSKAAHLLDVGGGNGSNVILMAERFSHLRATVFDSPSVCAIARERIQQAGMADRVGTFPGNCFTDPFPRDVDAILFAHFLTIWSASRNRALLRKCYEHLPKGGCVVVFNMMQRDTEDGPPSAAMGSPYFLTLATGEGMLYTWREYITWMREAGFASVSKTILPRDHGLIVGRKI